MMLAAGKQLGLYRILAAIGAGGMGEVYRATDITLRREVAIKVLPEAFARDAERLARFEREARVLASLNHPYIAAIHGLERAEGVPFLVLELVEGETLQGPVALEEALPIAKQICEALEAAHEKGVVHRDLKPANIKVTPEGKVKVLDFGLAKAFSENSGGSDASQSPTLTAGATRSGMMLGTPAYMSPEQARGKPVDKRTDIWAFGCVLYQLLVGQRAFDGENLADTIGAVMTREPDWGALPATTPESVRRLLQRCLQKDRDERLHDIADARLELKEASASIPRQTARPRALAWMIAAALATAGMLGVSLIHFRETPPRQQAVRLTLLPPEKTGFGDIAVSPDGRWVAFTALDAEGKSQLWVRPLDALSARVLGGTGGARYPFWSADSRWIGFFADGKLKKVDALGGPPQAIASAPSPRGGDWNRDGVILFAPNSAGPLAQVSAWGGDQKLVTELDASRQESSQRWPQFLPDGRSFLYFVRSSDPQQEGIYAGSLDSDQKTRLLASPASAAYGMGYLLFVRERVLLAQRLDPQRLQLAGEVFPVAEAMGVDATLRARVSLSQTGVLIYDLGARARRRLQWLDRSGKTLDSVDPLGDYFNVALSPDGRRVAADRTDPQTGNRDIWLFDLLRRASIRFTFHPAVDDYPVWSPDGHRIAFRSFRDGVISVLQKDSSGAGEEELLLKTPANKYPLSFSPDGRWLLYQEVDRKTRMDLWVLAVDRRQSEPWLRTEFEERNGRFSPDGQWVAYESNSSGRFEIYVQPFSVGGPLKAGRWQVSTGGGVQPRWRGDGKELFYLGPDRRLIAVRVTTAGGRFEADIPRALFTTRAAVAPGLISTLYGVTGDGQRFLIITEGEEEVPQPATVVMNWTAGLKK